mgnify:CR=1 FL=1
MTYDPSLDLIDLALREDLSLGDITSESTVPAGRQATATMLAKQDGVISGMETDSSHVSLVAGAHDKQQVARAVPLAAIAVDVGTGHRY